MGKTEKWLIVSIHSAALGCYMSEGALVVAREEVKLMAGEHLLFASHWTKSDTLASMFICLSGSISLLTVIERAAPKE
jgi:hypothetical protein